MSGDTPGPPGMSGYTPGPPGTIRVTINGEPRELAEETTVGGLVAAIAPAHKGIAVAVNEELVVRSRWDATRLRPGDRVEMLNAAQGG